MTTEALYKEVESLVKEGKSPTLDQIAGLNLKVLVELNRTNQNKKDHDISSLRYVVERIAVFAICDRSSDGSAMFVDCANTFRTLLMDSSQEMILPHTCTESTIEMISLLLCFYLVNQDLASFDLLSKLVTNTEIAQCGNTETHLSTINALHKSFMDGSLEESLTLIEKAQLESQNDGFARLTQQLAETTRELISASLEQSYRELKVDKVLNALHFNSLEQLNCWMEQREKLRLEHLEAVAIIPPEADIIMMGDESTDTAVLNSRLKHNDLIVDSALEMSEFVKWTVENNKGMISFTKSSASDERLSGGINSSAVSVAELSRMRHLFSFGEYIEDVL